MLLTESLWKFADKEIIEVTANTVTITWQFLGYKTSNLYAIEHIKDLRVAAMVANPTKIKLSALIDLNPNLLLAFDYGAKTFHCGIGLEEADAKQILQAIAQRFPHYQSSIQPS
jgi:hypothetical protein